jgi:hypothetical protein
VAFYSLLAVALAIGLIAAWRSGRQAEAQMQDRQQEQVVGLAEAINPDLAQAPTFTAAASASCLPISGCVTMISRYWSSPRTRNRSGARHGAVVNWFLGRKILM